MAASSNQILFLDYCGNDTAYDAFWDDSITLNTTNPDLTRCFQKTVMTSGSCLLLWLFSLFYFPHLLSLPTLHRWGYISRLNLLKVIAASLLVAVAAIDLCYFLSLLYDGAGSTSPQPVDFVDASIRVITFLLATIYTHWTFRKGIHSSGVLFLFWFFQLVFAIISFRSQIIQSQNQQETGFVTFTYGTFFVQFGLLLVQFITCLFSDLGALQTPEEEGHLSEEATPLLGGQTDAQITPRLGLKPCPKLTASFISELFFGWFTPTVIKGYRRALTYDDIWDIRREDSCSELVPRFQKSWTSELKKCDVRKRHLYISGEDCLQTTPSVGAASYTNGVASYGSQKDGKLDSTPLSAKFGPSPDEPSARKADKEPSLFFAIAKTLGKFYLYPGALLLLQDLIAFVNPMILSALITFVESRDPLAWKGYVFAVGMFFASLAGVLCVHHHFNLLYTAGMRVRTCLSSAIYRKALRLSSTARKNATVGEIVNLMSVDTQKIQDSAQFLHYLWSSPLMVALAMYFLWQILGPSSMAGLAFMLVVLPANSMILAKKIREFQREQMTLKDSRIKIINQVLNGMKVLKLYAWEEFFAQRILEIREKELRVLRKGAILGAVTYIMWFCSSFLVALLCFATYVLSSPTNILDAQTAFVSLSLIQVLNMPLTILPASIMFIVQSIVSLKRIQKFLLQEEIDPNNVQHDPTADGAINIERGYFSWGEEDRMTLKNISLRVPEGSLVAVVGTVGCGKSSLVSAMLGEMQKHQGSVNVKGSVAYVPQQAWIQNMTLKNNILFARPLDDERYSQVLDACALVPDLQILPGGDQTEIGERGINLSGGQKQRVSLARAVYQDDDIYLFDDPLSAVDAHVGKHIFNRVVSHEGLLKHKTRLLVTHGITYLPKVDTIIVLKDGVISEMGSYDDLISHRGAFAEFIHNFLIETNESEEEEDEELKETKKKLLKQVSIVSNPESQASDGTGSLKGSATLRKRKRKSTVHSTKRSEREDQIGAKEKESLAGTRLIEEETAEEGNVKFSVLKAYVTAASTLNAVCAILSLLLFIVAQVGTNIWLSEWTADVIVNGTQDTAQRDLRLGVYGGLGGAQTVAVLGLALSIALGAISASRTLHRKLLINVLKCPMSFFDTTPLGRIVNRFSKDVDICDSNIPSFTQNLMTTLAPLFSTIIVIIYSTPLFIVVVIPLAILFVILQRVYVTCARQIKRIDSIKRSPMYAFFSETLNGTSSIRAYQQQERFIQHSDDLLDNSTRVWFEVFTSNRWVGVLAELIGDVIILFAALFAVIERETLSPGLVGLSLSFALQISMNLIFTLRSSCELETYIVAVERIQEYTEAPTEADWILPDSRPPRDWPAQGEVAFQDYSTRYRPGLELVLRDLTCKVQPGEMVGIVGRTGAGKSSTTLALFRIIEASEGCIQIDGMTIAEMGLHDLRNKLTIIPQDPVIFSGSLRFNLDPSDKYTDAEVWEALEHAHLKTFVASLSGSLNYECGEDGENLSVGQRQLLCLARALLRKSKILILDEATAAVDLETDDLIQKTIRTEFKGCTVLTIAHRLNTIMDYDRVIVMSEGRVLEFDTPESLQNNKKSYFHSMARDAGLV